jgi:hypothetical protein
LDVEGAREDAANSDNGSGVNSNPSSLSASFSFGPSFTEVDFLFVFDNSVSMKRVSEQIGLGFESLGAAKWPKASRVGAITTMPADPADPKLARVHPEVKQYPGIDLEPGFLNLIDASAVSKFASAVGVQKASDAFPIPVCDKGWFLPLEKNSQGVSCLRSAFQSVFSPVVIEAGLTAANQMALKHPSLFRQGSQVHLVFVSDTEDPGGTSDSLTNSRPTFSDLQATFRKTSSIGSLKVHGVIPSSGCKTKEEHHQLVQPYKDAIKESGGVWLDFCDDSGKVRTNFVPVAEQIVEASFPDPVFSLPSPARSILEVKAAGKDVPIEAAKLDDDGIRVRIPSLKPLEDVAITIVYQPE